MVYFLKKSNLKKVIIFRFYESFMILKKADLHRSYKAYRLCK